jgi:hypothetical protein
LERVGSAVAVVRAAGVRSRRLRERAPFDLVFANILLPPLQRMAAPMASLTAPGAHIVLSGLLAAQGNAALTARSADTLKSMWKKWLDGILVCIAAFGLWALQAVMNGRGDELIDLVNRRPVTTLLVTHNLDEAIALADRVFLLTSSPAHVVAEIPIENPRTHRSPEEIAAVRAQIASKRKEVVV